MVYDYIDLDYWDGHYFDDDYDGTENDRYCKKFRRMSEEVMLEGFGEVKNELRGGAEVARQAHTLKVTGSIPVPATSNE